MTECEDSSVDFIVVAPPYNIGTKYGNESDRRAFEDYERLMTDISKESHRIVKNTGKVLVEAADSVLMGGSYVQLAGMIQSLFLKEGFHLQERHINFVHTNSGVELTEDSRWDENYSTRRDAHSNAHQWMVFTKEPTDFRSGRIFYVDYVETPVHPCPFPEKVVEIFLDSYFKSGDTVLEPFMGVSTLGREVLRRGGRYVGYEIDETIFHEAEKNLQDGSLARS